MPDLIILVFEFLSMVWEGIDPAIERPLRVWDRNRTLKWVARRLGGRHEPERYNRPASVAWDVEKTSVRLRAVENRHSRHSGFALRIHQSCAFRLRLMPETGWQRVRKFFGAQDLQTGDQLFDRTFLVHTNLPERARSLLARNVRVALANLARRAPVAFEAGPTGMTIRTPERFEGQLNRLTDFAQEALNVARILLRLMDPAILASEVLTAVGSCPVCATPVESDRSLCSRCRTPHHKDCWNYLGGCAMYACSGRPSRVSLVSARERMAPAAARR